MSVEKLFGHMATETRLNIAGVIRKEAYAILGVRQTNAGLDAEDKWGEGEDWDYLRRRAAQYMAVAKWFEDQ